MAANYERSAEAGAQRFPDWDSRRYRYYQPAGRKATLYEDVTVDVQPDPDRYLLQGWIISFADGTPAYSSTRTRLKSSDWHRYRAPDEEWERPHYQRQSAIVRMVQQAVANGRAQGVVALFDLDWVSVLQNHFSASKHAEYGLGIALMSGQRDGMTQMINNAILVNASYKLRYAQDITLYLADIAPDLGPSFDEAQGKAHWMSDEVWQPTRALVETVLAATDHLEQYFAINLIVEPLVMELFRSAFIAQVAALHGDFLTPTVVSAAEADYTRNMINTVTLMQQLATDPVHAASNQAVMKEWVARYLPLAQNAAQHLQPVWSLPRMKVHGFQDAYQRATRHVDTLLTEVGIAGERSDSQ
ncbi:MAG: toluene hydroxylase [Sulfobacillus thermotolerans]|nr:toluene hydroxylase [Sulfobacillus thermotolerans]